MMALHCGDCLEIMRDMPSDSIDLIATDPPFNTGKDWGEFNDKWEGGLVGYMKFMDPRLREMHRLLKDTGSLYLHCDTNASHYLKVMLDGIFGIDNFRNEIVWKRCNPQNDAVTYGKIYDVILFYSASKSYVFNHEYVPYTEEHLESSYKYSDDNGRRFSTVQLTSGSLMHKGYKHEYEWNGIKTKWRYPFEKMKEYEDAGRLHYSTNGIPRLKIYLDDMPGSILQNIWTDISSIGTQTNESNGYSTQKPVALYSRIIKASSNQGDVVLDPFCGSGTTLESAKLLGRKWIGIDLNPKAIEISDKRLNPEQMDLF